MFPTYIPDVDISILLEIPDTELVDLQLTCTYLNQLIKSEAFWFRRYQRYLPADDLFTKKPINTSYARWYYSCRVCNKPVIIKEHSCIFCNGTFRKLLDYMLFILFAPLILLFHLLALLILLISVTIIIVTAAISIILLITLVLIIVPLSLVYVHYMFNLIYSYVLPT